MNSKPSESHLAQRTVTVREGAIMIGCSPSRVRALIATGKLHAVKLAGPRTTRLFVEDVEKFLAKLRESQTRSSTTNVSA